ncbi:MAG: hypothetical protein GWN01_16570 [Nitrosopumilaceae archaeon]|nr:hypothetical protein [Nitrosopumilaceae archaeon]NIU02447.1 hypothetical protein [Nitrosopumilaceae archaeon]NIU88908.1 hypothetical protein [Nitrosopumilaceae archaeon]NIV67019.1 hypothetical protein [Nitrosopumilaceae archaeon]NIX63048.1 hypothetical protein [Nitrosopumilaceae archaeon]
MVDLSLIGQVGSIGTAFATIALVFIFWRAIKQMEHTVKLSKIQTEHRFRPWIGPFDQILALEENNGKTKFDIGIKNYGEIPSTNVIAYFTTKPEMISREDLENPQQKYDLGPLLPNMEKHYWFFLDSEKINDAISGNSEIYTGLYFSYESKAGSESGYGLISKYDPKTNSFVHKDMWTN